MRNRPITGMSFYQCANRFDGPPVAGTNGITEDMITSGNERAAVTDNHCDQKLMINVSKVFN